MSSLLYIALCVSIPTVWGVFSFFVFGAIRRRRAGEHEGPPPIDYSI